MKRDQPFRDADVVKRYIQAIHDITDQPWTIMEICGGQTHAFLRHGIDTLLPPDITLLHGPGCPVCVTPIDKIDKAIELAQQPDIMLCSFGDMVRVPGSREDLLSVKSRGGDVRIVYSPTDALKLARQHPDKQVVFFGIGFETTAPANAMAVLGAQSEQLNNFSVLTSQVRVPPAIRAILSSDDCRVNGFLAAGHVCTVMGYHEYTPLAKAFKTPMVVTGFEPVDLVQGMLMCIRQLREGRYEVENPYKRSVTEAGNRPAQQALLNVFERVDQTWRGIGVIPDSGLALRDQYAAFDAEKKFQLKNMSIREETDCMSGLVLQGLKKPTDCPCFADSCTPEHPLGATMVSSEGACAAYYRYRKR
ncbi:MAG: hydrogenase formation protein HypD [candidate division KSB1 bacterium]|nr:hydrogenase formation protein HypD [candidate division KSB1 bacterium]